jgi:glycosyltransferase involved in cell wall biosynthesis
MTKAAVIHACDYGAPYAGNFLTSQLALAEQTRERLGLRSYFVLPTRARNRAWLSEIERRGFAYGFMDKREPRRRRAARVAAAVRSGPAILHSHFYAFDLDCVLAARRNSAARVVWHIQSGLAKYPLRQRLSDVFKVRLVGRRECDLLIACGEAARADSLRRGFRPDAVTVIPNAITLDRFVDAERGRAEMRRQLGIPDDTTMLLSFAWDPERKGADLVVEAMSRMRPDGARLVLVGQERLRAFLRNRIDGTAPPWLVIAEPVEDVAALYAAADIFVSAARSEGLPYAIGEAMAAGLPVVSSDIPWVAEYASAPGVVTFSSGDPGALHDALESLVGSPSRAPLGSRNREFAWRELAVERYVDRVLGEYARLLDA